MDPSELLLEDDLAFLQRKGWVYQLHPPATNGTSDLYIVFPNFPLSERYIPREVKLLLKLPAGYPDNGIDMWWTIPYVVVTETNQQPQATEVREDLLGEKWQRWSRHLTWRPGEDSLESFFMHVIKELKS